ACPVRCLRGHRLHGDRPQGVVLPRSMKRPGDRPLRAEAARLPPRPLVFEEGYCTMPGSASAHVVPAGDAPMSSAPGSLLIVDDDDSDRSLLRRYFEGRGFVVADAPDGNQA